MNGLRRCSNFNRHSSTIINRNGYWSYDYRVTSKILMKRNAKIFSGIGSIIIFGALIAFGLLRFRTEKTGFVTLFWFLFIIAMSWNVIDLLVMDWLLVCTVRPAWLIIPGTENCSSYGAYGHHFKGFLIGCIYTTLMALIFAEIDYAILYFLVWK